MYDHLTDDEFDGLYCACGGRMHASDTECARCYRDRDHGDEYDGQGNEERMLGCYG